MIAITTNKLDQREAFASDVSELRAVLLKYDFIIFASKVANFLI